MANVINSNSVNENGLGEVTTAVEAWLENETETSATLYVQARVTTESNANTGEEGEEGGEIVVNKLGIAVQAGYSEGGEPVYGDVYYGVVDYSNPPIDAAGVSSWEIAKTKEIQTITCYAKSYGYQTEDGDEAYPTDNLVSCEIEIPAITSYTVEFNANGGSDTLESQVKWYGEDLVLPVLLEENAPVANAYTFKGWSVSASSQKVIGDNYTGNEDAVLYAVWEAKSYTVTFDANGGDAPTPSSNTVTYNSAYGSLPTPKRTGHTFNGWFTETTGGDKVTSSTVMSVVGDHSIYAQWTINTYTISYNVNGGNDVNGTLVNQIKTYGQDLTLHIDKPEKTGYDFIGWSDSGDDKVVYESGAVFTPNKNTTLHAVWKIKTFKISYSPNSGTYAPEATVKEYGTDVTVTTELPFKNGYKFLGWSDASEGVVKYVGGDTYSDNVDVTLYALWEQIPIMRMLNKHEIYDEVAREHISGFVTHGDGNAYTVNVRGLYSLEVGTGFTIVPHVESTSVSPTLDVNGFGAKEIRQRVLGRTSSAVGDVDSWLSEGKPVDVVFDGEYWIADVYGITPIESGGTGANSAVEALHNLGIHWGFDDAETYWSGIENGNELKKNTIYIQIN